jgi:DNA-3-methyladenine glycosylase II
MTALDTRPAGTFTIRPQGPFSLREAALFGFGQRHAGAFDGTMRMAFTVDGYAGQAAVAVTQDRDETVAIRITGTSGPVDATAVVAQVARVLSLDHDATSYVALGDEDPVIARLLAAAPGLRPPLFHSPYEAALWAVISARRSPRTADAWRTRLAAHAGVRFDIDGEEQFAVPVPERILALGPAGCRACGIDPLRAERVVGVAHAAAEGLLDVGHLSAMDHDRVRRQLRTISGIGPFYADLILIRALGLTDVLAVDEPRLLATIGDLYRLGGPATQSDLEALATAWTPWRTWITVLVRAAGPRVLGSRPH